jgi:hypothetical protein
LFLIYLTSFSCPSSFLASFLVFTFRGPQFGSLKTSSEANPGSNIPE